MKRDIQKKTFGKNCGLDYHQRNVQNLVGYRLVFSLSFIVSSGEKRKDKRKDLKHLKVVILIKETVFFFLWPVQDLDSFPFRAWDNSLYYLFSASVSLHSAEVWL